MKKLVTTWVMAVALLGTAGITHADPVKPFVSISATSDVLELGMAPFMGIYDSPTALTVQVESNCLHGPVVASITSLKHKHRRGASIQTERIFIKAPATGGFVPMVKPVAVSKPETGSHDIVLSFRVKTMFGDPAGRYKGTITFTVMPP